MVNITNGIHYNSILEFTNLYNYEAIPLSWYLAARLTMFIRLDFPLHFFLFFQKQISQFSSETKSSPIKVPFHRNRSIYPGGEKSAPGALPPPARLLYWDFTMQSWQFIVKQWKSQLLEDCSIETSQCRPGHRAVYSEAVEESANGRLLYWDFTIQTWALFSEALQTRGCSPVDQRTFPNQLNQQTKSMHPAKFQYILNHCNNAILIPFDI